jgi:hypothetical protein
MADARQRIWHRVGPAAVAMSALLVGLGAPGCDGGDGTTGGAGGSGQNLEDITVKSAASVKAFDSTPDANGENIYFTGRRDGEVGVFKIDAKGEVTDIYVGDPLGAPLGIAVDTTDKALFVADTAYDNTADDPESARGAILTLGLTPGAPSPLTKTAGYQPRGLDVVKQTEGDMVFFSGIDATSKEPGLFSILTAGGGVSAIVKGAPFIDPSGVAVGKDQTFVTDSSEEGTSLSSVIVVKVGYPAGVALSLDEKTLYISGLDPDTGFDTVYVVEVSSKDIQKYAKGGIETKVDALGLHRARNADVFAWSGANGTKNGTVFKITVKQ